MFGKRPRREDHQLPAVPGSPSAGLILVPLRVDGPVAEFSVWLTTELQAFEQRFGSNLPAAAPARRR